MTTEQVTPVHVGRALESLRNSNFNTVSAMGEVIDNSIEANAKNIRIAIKKEKIRGERYDLTEVAFGDDGIGMNQDILHRCLQLGFSSRFNSRKGIGRFGVGMTLGAITQCTRIEVYSKPKGGEWNFTYLDLDEIKEHESGIIPVPIHTTIPEEYAELIGDKGTLVIWKNWDREDATIDEMSIWIGRTYRKFIGSELAHDGKIIKNTDQRDIFLDEKKISAFDPLYAIKTDYNSEGSQLASEITIEEEIHKFDAPPEKKHGSSEIKIRFALTPKEWRSKGKGHDGNSPENRKRFIPNNEGVSILRNGREVFYGPIAYYDLSDKTSGKGFINPDRFWGCEISFNAELDQWFTVNNIKVGARPRSELRKVLENAMNPTIYSYRKAIRKIWSDKEVEENAKTGGATSGTSSAEDALSKNISKKEKATEQELDEIIRNAGIKQDEIIKTLKQKMSDRPYVFVKSEDIDRRGDFIDITTRGKTSLISLNMNHPFFRKLFKVLKELESKEDGEGSSEKIQTICLLLLGTFAAAKNEFNPEEEYTADEFIDKLLHNWTFHLSKNVDTIKEE